MTDPGLRERKKADTRRALSNAAMQLAHQRGLDNVTREDIAQVAGVSLRTFNNYFNGKYEALAYRQAERFRRGVAELRRRPADEPLWSALSHSWIKPLEEDFADAEADEHQVGSREELVEIRKLLMSPEIRNAVSKDLFDDWLQAIAERTGTDPEHDLYPRLVLAVLRAVLDAAADAFVAADPPVPITTFIRQGLDAVAAGLPEPPKTTGDD